MPASFGRPATPPGTLLVSEDEGRDWFEPVTFDAYVDPSGTVSDARYHTTLAAAVAAATAGDRIAVLDDLTMTAAGQFDIGKRCTIDFLGHTITNACTSSGVDVITSGLSSSSTSYVGGVHILNLGGVSRSGTGNGGTAINLHGTQNWTVEMVDHAATVSGHDVGVSFDANPYPSGQCFHNTVGSAAVRMKITGCGVAVQAVNGPNENVAHVNAYNNDQAVNVESGKALRLPNLCVEVGSGSIDDATPQVNIGYGSEGTFIDGLYCETLTHDPAILVDGIGVTISGTGYNDVSGSVVGVGDNANHYGIRLAQTSLQSHLYGSVRLPDVTSTGTYTVDDVPTDYQRYRVVSVLPNGACTFSDGNYWTIQLQEWVAGVNVQNLGTLYTQSGTIEKDGVDIAGLPVTIRPGRQLRVVFTKYGSASTLSMPLIKWRYDTVTA